MKFDKSSGDVLVYKKVHDKKVIVRGRVFGSSLFYFYGRGIGLRAPELPPWYWEGGREIEVPDSMSLFWSKIGLRGTCM